MLPKPVSSCRYFHRSLDWLKLYEVGFSPLPSNSTKARQITKYHLPSQPASSGLRQMEQKDATAVQDLLDRYLKRFDMAPDFDKEEVEHWLLHDTQLAEQVIWTYVVEDPKTHKITDFFSFYCLESSVIGNQKHDNVRAAYLFYYATETAFAKEEKGLKERLNLLMTDALVLAKKVCSDISFGISLADSVRKVQLRRLQRFDTARQSSLPGAAEVRSRRRPAALLPVQLPHCSHSWRCGRQKQCRCFEKRRHWSRDGELLCFSLSLVQLC